MELTVDHAGEYLCTCTHESGCQHFLKFPADCDLAKAMAVHNEHNQSRVLANADGSVIVSPERQAQIDAAVVMHSN